MSPDNWYSTGRRTKPDLEKELPEVFADQPQEVDDYIRPEKTFFERLEDWWDWIISFMAPVDKQIELMQYVRANGFFGIPLDYGGVFFVWGVCIRLITMGPQLYVHRNGLRLAKISPQLSEIANLEKKTKSDRTISTADKRVIKEGYKRMKAALHKKHKCSQARTFIQGFFSPLMVTAFMAIRRLAAYEEELETTSFLWIKDLTMPDPTWILPVTCVGLFMLNYELNSAMAQSGRSANKMYIRWAIRGGSVVFLYFFQSQPAGLFCYWIGMSLIGLLSPMLLRWSKFREFFDFPPRPRASIEYEETTAINKLLVKLGVRRAPTEEEQEEMSLKAEEFAKKKFNENFSSIRDFDVLFDDELKVRGRKGSSSPLNPTK